MAEQERIVHGFIHDASFIDRARLIAPGYPQSGLFVPKDDRLSYFVQLYKLIDTRDIRTPTPSFTTTQKPCILIDRFAYTEFLADYENYVTTPEKTKLFNIIERCLFSAQPTDNSISINTELGLNSALYGIYVPGSFTTSSLRETGIAYSDTGVETPVTAPTWIRFKVILTTLSGPDVVEFKFWSEDVAFGNEYPLSFIMETVNPLPFETLLYGPIVGGTNNPFAVVADSARIGTDKLNPKIKTEDNSGLWLQRITFYDSSNNSTLVPFQILYKGQRPSISQIRKAIRELVLGSGVGTENEWRARAPELFIEDQFLLIPQYNILTYRPTQIIYPNVSPWPKMIANSVLALTHLSTDYITDNIEVIPALYDTNTLTAVPNDLNLNHTKIGPIHPTYQIYSSTEPGFISMEVHTREFSLKLNSVLAIAAGKAVPGNYDIRTEYGADWVAFTVGFVEYVVMTRESFSNKIGIPTE